MKLRNIIKLMAITIMCLLHSSLFGYIEFKDGGDHNIDYQINTEVWVDFGTPGIHTTMNFVTGGGTSTGRDLYAYEDSQINIIGGNVNGYLYAKNKCQVTVSNGQIKDLRIYDMSQALLSGGYISSLLHTYGSSEATLSGTSLGQGLLALDNSTVYIYGGSIGFVQLRGSSIVYLYGGRVSSSSYSFRISNDSVLTIKGTNFAVDGSPVGYGELRSIYGGDNSGEPLRNLTGTLFDGSVLNNAAFDIGGNGRIILAPPPSYVLTISVEPADIGINSVTPILGNHNKEGWCNISATQYVSCPDVYRYDHWEGDVTNPNLASTTVFMDSDKTITAVFNATRKCGDECHPDNLLGDFNHDCIINLIDLSEFASNWLVCTKPECDSL